MRVEKAPNKTPPQGGEFERESDEHSDLGRLVRKIRFKAITENLEEDKKKRKK